MNYVSSVPASPWGALEVLAVLALMVGTFVIPIVGPIVGMCLAWGSSRWTTREKIIATVLPSSADRSRPGSARLHERGPAKPWEALLHYSASRTEVSS